MKILGTGLRGLVGSRIVELLKDGYEFEVSDIDITDRHRVLEGIKNSDAQVVLHLAAKTDVDGCEEDKKRDIEILRYKDIERQEKEWGDKKTAWAVNVVGTENIADACQVSNKKLIYISTDFVFDGTNPPDNGYSEEDTPDPINWYGKTKYEGEKIVQELPTSWLIVRIAYPYRGKFEKLDFFRAILNRLQKGEKVIAVTDHIFTPTFIDDIAFAIDCLIRKKEKGLFHVVGSQALSPFEAAVVIAKVFGYDQKAISKTTRLEFFKNRSPRPFQLTMNNDKIERLGIKMKTFEEGVKAVKGQMSKFKSTS